MKIASFCRTHGHSVVFVESYDDLENYDWLFLSCVFSYTKESLPEGILDSKNISAGGTGIDPTGKYQLPYEVEHSMPYYDLYKSWAESQLAKGKKRSSVADYLDYSIGFLTRGCFRKCDFCVNKKYDHVFKSSSLEEFLDQDRPYIYLWDDNFLGYKDWKDALKALNDSGKPFQFRQGLDIRLMTKEKATALAKSRYHGDYIFAFDHIKDRDVIEKKLRIWRDATRRGTRLYVLCAYDSQDVKDIESVFARIKILMHYSCLPYIMRYEAYKECELKSLYVAIARWCNQPHIFKKMSFRQFCEANQNYHKNPNTFCSSLRAMRQFEAENPEIAKQYFDLRYEEERKY